jgi:hypothetical protein
MTNPADEKRRAMREPQASTMHEHAQSMADETNQGRFRATGTPTVIGAMPIPKYPELPSDLPWHHDPVPDEPPLGYEIHSLDPFAPSPLVTAQGTTGDPASERPVDRPHPADVERGAGSPPSSPIKRQGDAPSKSDTEELPDDAA